MDYRIECYPNVKCIDIDFGEVEVGVTKIKSIKIVNQCDKKQSYWVQRDSASNPLDCVFHTLEYTWCLRPSDSYVCDISFKPILPNRRYTDYFFITDTFKCCYKIVVGGYCIGPSVTSSASRCVMVKEHKECKIKHCLKLTNQTNVPAKFMFDIDTIQCPFKVSEVNGVIKPLSSKCFVITFEPANCGIYKYHMPCLILNQSPIIFELYGISGDIDDKIIDNFISRIDLIEELDNDHFKNYMSDITTAVKSLPPPLSLSCSFVDFGQAVVGTKNVGKRTPHTICMTNHQNLDLLVFWEKDKSGTFSIHPDEAILSAHQSIIFEIRFDPMKERTFYSRELLARIFRMSCCPKKDKVKPENLLLDVIPEFVTLRLIGHTYSYDSNNWMPQYDIPEMVTMPACLPALPAYTTFPIRNFGPQPLMFCFVPPNISHYNVKPMLGLISSQQEQVISVQLFPEAEGDHAYVERWAVRFNGNSKNEIYIDFHGFTELANLTFGFDNSVTFDSVCVNCEKSLKVPVRNTTRHNVKFEYSLQTLPEQLCTEQKEGFIGPNETTCHDWTFSPDSLRNYDFDIFCCITAEIGGKTSSVRIEVTGSGAEGSLIAMPDELRLGNLAYNEVREVELKIFNFSSVTMNFLLSCRPTKTLDIMDYPENDVKISPIRGTITPGKAEKIRITINPKQPGFYELTLEYSIRQNAESCTAISKPKHLCILNFMCYLPTTQIKDLLYRAETNKDVSKISLWKSLCIDEWNEALRDLMPSHEASINMILPFVSLNEDEIFIIKLQLKNVTPLEASWFLCKRKTCFCNDKDAKYKFPMNRNLNNPCRFCIHDKSIKLYPKKITLQANETVILTIEVEKDTLKPEGIFWDLDIGEQRNIVLNIKLETSILLSGPYLKFQNICLGQGSVTHYKAIWIFNDTEIEYDYKIDIQPLACINKQNYAIIFTCLNPEGVINGYSRKPVFFGFCPNKLGNFQLAVSVQIGGKQADLNIEADCTLTSNPSLDNETCPNGDCFIVPEMRAYFNNTYSVIPPLPTHSKVTKLVLVHNHHTHNVLHYTWTSYEIPKIVKVDITPSRGYIQPQSIITFLIEVYSGPYMCSLDIDLFCDFLDVSERRIAEKKKRQQEQILEQIKDEFTITEKGCFPAKPPVFEEIKKPLAFCKTLTLKINMYDVQSVDAIVNLEEQLRSIPSEEVVQEQSLSVAQGQFNILDISSQIFECLIWDIMHSKSFGESLKKLSRVHHLKYAQFPTNILDRQHKLKRIDWSPGKRTVESLLHNMINMIIHEEFNFVHNNVHPSDARKLSYQKVYFEIRRSRLSGPQPSDFENMF